MKLRLYNVDNIVEEQLKNHAKLVIRTAFFDVTFDNKSELVLKLLDDGKYSLSYTRPIFFNPFQFNVFDYKFVFSVEKENENLYVNGNVRLKTFVIILLFILFLILGYNTFTDISEKDVFFWIFSIGPPITIFAYLFVEYLIFKKKARTFLESFGR